MKIQLASDIHLDQLKSYNNSDIIYPGGDILVLAGDICHICTIKKHEDFFNFLSKNYHYVLYVPGNHEFYNNSNVSIEKNEIILITFLRKFHNFIYLNNNSVIIENFLFSGSCLWNKPEKINEWFRINTTIDNITNLHNKSINFLEQSKHNYTHIVITHYPPPSNIDIHPKVWIYGHTHKNILKYENATFYVSNQRKGKKYSNMMILKL